MRYSIDQYDKNGFLKAPIWLWLGWMLLAKDWVIFIIAGVSREHGSKLLTMLYPTYDLLYFGIAMGVPSVALMWSISLRQPDRKWLNYVVSWGKPVTLLVAILQLTHGIYNVVLSHGQFHWLNSVTLLLLGWFILYVCKSKTVRTCFQIPQWEK
ncbi:DUF2919 domain-containing protein [Vibrio sonorensis]|uniref:DUF2919 domain-containing protein n=1 Tax=Vibrio sonorensis TaxID=1004316 RepID=UPI0008D8FAE3|nr:DUF2919 domain-containing protein [Vibrio sonorensis]